MVKLLKHLICLAVLIAQFQNSIICAGMWGILLWLMTQSSGLHYFLLLSFSDMLTELVVTWCFMMWSYFYGFGHQATIPAIRFEAAFVGRWHCLIIVIHISIQHPPLMPGRTF